MAAPAPSSEAVRWGAWLAVGLTALASLPAAAAGDGQIGGRVIDRTAPAHALAGQVVRLAIIERATSEERTTLSDAAGSFRFSGLPVGGIRLFVIGTDYRGVRYTGNRLTLNPEARTRAEELSVYEASSDRSAMRATTAFAVVDIAPGALRIRAVQRFENPSDRTIVIPPRDPLTFPLPAGAESVIFLAGWRDPRLDGGRITDALPLLPGVTQVAYAYGLRATRREVIVPWLLPYGAIDVEMLVSDAGVEVTGDGLRARGNLPGPSGQRFLRFSGGPIPSQGAVMLRLRNVPSARNPWPAGVTLVLALVLAAGLAAALRGPARPAADTPRRGS
jgi:hypothetical protein